MPKTRRDENDDSDDAIQSVLVSGYKRFRRETMMMMCHRRNKEEDQDQDETMETRLKRLSREGQKGACKILCVSCCDSRCDPTAVFDAKPGEIFSVRNVANVVPPLVKRKEKMKDHGTVSAIEYAVKSLEVEAIVVLGHAQCGGCAHALHLFSSPKTKTSEKTKDDDDDDDDDGIIIETPRAGRKYLLKKDFGNERIESAFKRFLCTGGSI